MNITWKCSRTLADRCIQVSDLDFCPADVLLFTTSNTHGRTQIAFWLSMVSATQDTWQFWCWVSVSLCLSMSRGLWVVYNLPSHVTQAALSQNLVPFTCRSPLCCGDLPRQDSQSLTNWCVNILPSSVQWPGNGTRTQLTSAPDLWPRIRRL